MAAFSERINRLRFWSTSMTLSCSISLIKDSHRESLSGPVAVWSAVWDAANCEPGTNPRIPPNEMMTPPLLQPATGLSMTS
jgi:hypothetical protein